MFKARLTRIRKNAAGSEVQNLEQGGINSFEILPNGFLVLKVKDNSTKNSLIITPNQDQRVVALNMNRWDKMEILEDK